MEPHQLIAKNEIGEEISNFENIALMQLVASSPWILNRTCAAAVFSSIRNPRLRASPTASAVMLLLWQEMHPAFFVKKESARCSNGRLS
jgi:hypothetical protein